MHNNRNHLHVHTGTLVANEVFIMYAISYLLFACRNSGQAYLM